jgi:hypothetical protein
MGESLRDSAPCVGGGNLFKAIGGKYGEFLDFDETTASRAKLDVARLKISTSFRGCIDEPIKIMVLGVLYTFWVVEEKVWNQTGEQQS